MTQVRAKQDEERPLVEHLRELMVRLRRIVVSLLVIFAIFMTIGVNRVQMGGLMIPIPYPTLFNSISVDFVRLFINAELPKGVTLLILNPFDPLFASMEVSLMLGFFISTPIILREIWAFISPALYEHEKRLLKWTVIPAMLLFAAGAMFSYFVVTPEVLDFVRFYSQSLGIQPTLSLRSFVNIVVSFMIALGISFEMPLVMVVTTRFGFVSSRTWMRNWRRGVLGSFIIALFISPGTTGGVMETLIGLTLSSLYMLGALISSKVERRKLEERLA